jgi:hypothetical protein
MGNSQLHLRGRLGGPDIHMPVKLQGIGIYDFYGKLFIKFRGYSGLADSGRPLDYYDLLLFYSPAFHINS